jgi:large subunit ribosomal protein L31
MDMKPDIHPKYSEIKIICSCGNEITTRSTLGEDIHIEVCSSCHPFYTGKQKIVDTGGRVDKFRKRYTKSAADKQPAPEKKLAPEKKVTTGKKAAGKKAAGK